MQPYYALPINYCVMLPWFLTKAAWATYSKVQVITSTAERHRVDNRERRPGSPSHIFSSSSSCSVHQKGCRWYKGLQPYYALPTIANYCVIPTVVSDQSGMSGLLKN